MKFRILLVIGVLFALLLTSCTVNDGVSKPLSTSANTTDGNSSSNSDSGTASNGIMGNFSASDLNGNTVNQSIFAEYDLTMVNIWATYCGPCINEMPELGELSDEYASKGVRIVGMVSDLLNSNGSVNESQRQTALDIVSTTGADYLHLIPSSDLYGLLSQVTAVPTTFFVDSTGTQVGGTYVGSRSKSAWAEIIDSLLPEVNS